jgi:hypothetical protein
VVTAKTKREYREISDTADTPGVTEMLQPIRHEEDTCGAACLVGTTTEDVDGGTEATLDVGVAACPAGVNKSSGGTLPLRAHLQRRIVARFPGFVREGYEHKGVHCAYLLDDELGGLLHVSELPLLAHAPAGV